nr:putative 6-phosphogluconolactonase [Quercus suber]
MALTEEKEHRSQDNDFVDISYPDYSLAMFSFHEITLRVLAIQAISTLATVSASCATNLFAADYSGSVTSLSLTNDGVLRETASNAGCAPNPSWLTIDTDHNLLFCLNEGLTSPNGSLSSFTINDDGSLNHIKNATSINGPVSGIIYGASSGQRAIALAHYGGSAVSSWLLEEGGDFEFNQTIAFTLAQPGPVPDRQEAPHEHEAIVDPTGQFILVPDLGADLVRVFSYDDSTLLLSPLDPLQAAPGSGPRHAAFWTHACSDETYFYLVAELASTVTAYHVTYLPGNDGLQFDEVFKSTTFGSQPLPAGNAPAEIHVTPDNQYLIISNRGDKSFDITLNNGTQVPSDTLSTFSIQANGSLSLHQLSPAGGSFPRQYSINAAGDKLAVGLQNNNEVVILSRDVASGMVGQEIARIGLGGPVTCVVWDE